MDALKNLYQRVKDDGRRIDNVVTHGISCSVYFFDPEDNRIEIYYKTRYIVKQGFSRPIDLENQSNEEILEFSGPSRPLKAPSEAPSFQ
jgi:catechol-2,3-dioxygenase